MRILTIIALFIFFISSGLANDAMESYVGCYKTLTWNGVQADLNNSKNISTIKKGESQLTLNLDYSRMPAYEMSLYKRGSGFFASYAQAFPLIGEGNYLIQDNLIEFNYNGELRYRPQPNYTGEIDHLVNIETQVNGNLKVYVHTQIESIISVDQIDEFLLTPVACFN